MSSELSTVLLKLLSARTVEATWTILTAELDAFGFDRLLYGMTRFRTAVSLGDPQDMLILSNHPDDYVEAFVNGRMFANAPMTMWAIDNEGAMSWSLVADMADALSAEQKQVLECNFKKLETLDVFMIKV